MRFHEIEFFLTVADCLSYSTAASKLYISQPCLSKTIAGMENELGFKLFQRSTRRVELTEKGRSFYSLSKDFQEQCEALAQGGHTADTFHGTLAIACENIVDSTYMPFIVAAFRQKYPGVNVSTSIQKTETMLTNIGTEKTDIGLLSSFAISRADFQSTLLYPYQLQILVWRGHPLSKMKSVRFEDLEGETFIILDPSTSRSSETILRLCAAAGFVLKESEYAANYRQMFLLTSQKEGISFNLAVSDAATYWDLCSIDVDLSDCPGLASAAGVALAWSKGCKNPAVERFLATVETLRLSMPRVSRLVDV